MSREKSVKGNVERVGVTKPQIHNFDKPAHIMNIYIVKFQPGGGGVRFLGTKNEGTREKKSNNSNKTVRAQRILFIR